MEYMKVKNKQLLVPKKGRKGWGVKRTGRGMGKGQGGEGEKDKAGRGIRTGRGGG